MYEYPDETFEYPSYKNYSIDFAHEVQRNIENSNYFSLKLYNKVIESIRSPLLQMLLANFMYMKITNVTVKPSFSVIFKAIHNNDADSFADDVKSKCVNRSIKTEQFPKYDEKKKVQRCVVYKKDFLRLLMIYTNAVNNYYRISAAIAEIQKTEIISSPSSQVQDIQVMPFDEEIFLKSLNFVDLNEKVNLRKIDLNFKKMVHIRLSMDTCYFYRNEIKYLIILIKLIKNYHTKDGAQFDDWMNFIQHFEAASVN